MPIPPSVKRAKDCVQRRIRHHMHHRERHASREQIIAIAHSECGKSKYRSAFNEDELRKLPCYEEQKFCAFSAEETQEKLTLKNFGGQYIAIDNGDGTYTIKGVPIFGPVPEGVKGAPQDIGFEWQSKAVEAAQRDYEQGRLYPLHIGHHEIGQKPEPAGFFLPTHVAYATFGGTEGWWTFADLLKIPKHIFERIRNLQLPYVSVEIADYDEPLFASLSLLDTKPSFFRTPLLTIGRVMTVHEYEHTIEKPQAAQAYAWDGKSGAILFQVDYQRINPNEEKHRRGEKYAHEGDEDEDKEKEGAKMDNEKKPDSGHEVIQEILETVRAMAAAMGLKTRVKAAADESDAGTPDAKPVEQKEPPGGGHMGQESKELAALRAKVLAMEDKLRRQEFEAEVRAKFEAAVKELAAYEIPEKARELLLNAARQGDKPLRDQVEALKAVFPKKDSAGTLQEFEQSLAELEPKVLEKYDALGPEAGEKARRELADYAKLRKLFPSRRWSLSEEDWLDMADGNLMKGGK